MATIDQTPQAQRVYDAFLVAFPDVPVIGLFGNNNRFAIVVSGIDDTSTPAINRLISAVASVFLWIEVLQSVPEGYAEVSTRTERERRSGKGAYVTTSEWDRVLALHLPADFPYAGCEANSDGVALLVRVSRSLKPQEQVRLTVLLDELGFTASTDTKIVEPGEILRHRHRSGNDGLVLKPSRWFDSLPGALTDRLEQDEELWRHQSRTAISNNSVKSPWQEAPGSSCLVQTVFPPDNIRAYLSLYSHVIVEAPFADSVDQTLGHFGVDRRSFRDLVASGSVRLIVPQSIERYDAGWLASLCEAAPSGVMFSRQLASLAEQDQARRNPLLLTSADADSQRAVLRALGSIVVQDDFRSVDGIVALKSLRSALSEYWVWSQHLNFARGAMSSGSSALALHAIHLMRELHQKDYTIELAHVAARVEWAGALGAHIVPFEHEEYSEVGAASVVVALASGIRTSSDPVSVASPRVFAVASELLAFANDTNVMEFARDLGSGDLARFRGLVASIVKPGRSPEEIEEIVNAWNAQVRHYNRSPDRVRSFGIGGIIMSALALGNLIPGAELVPYVAPFLPLIMTTLTEDLAHGRETIGQLLDRANATLAGAVPPAVLLARMRRRVAGMK